ncbi:MAG: hypothetical protein IJB57_07230, partial [Clostridia bacterium]|nr:hypothetical protein [Clostridia bacterium]
ACKTEINTRIDKKEITSCTKGTDAYFRRVANLYNEVLEETQQSNDVLFKSEMQRSKSFVLQQATLFKTDMFVNYNILHSGAARLNATRAMVKNASTDAEKAKAEHLYKQARKSFGKAVASQLIGNALLTLLTLLGNGVFRHKLDKYRDEEGELSAEGVLWELFQIYLGTAAETVTAPVSAFFDWAGYLESLVTGDKFYENEDLVSGMVSDLTNGTGKLIDAVISMWDEDTTTADKAKGMIDSFKDTAVVVLEAIGVPAGNIEDIANAAWLYGQDLFTDKKLFESGYDISNKERIAKVSELIEKGKHQDTGKYVSDWVSEKALELAEKDGVSDKDLEKHDYFKNKYTDKAKDYIKSLFREKYKDEYLDAVEKKDVKTVKKIKVILYNTRLYAEKDKSGNEINDIDAVFTDWRKSAFEKEYKDKYKDACGTGDEKEMKRIEAAVRASGFYKKPNKTLKNWREAAEEIKDAEE